jgi:hypothetical protein
LLPQIVGSCVRATEGVGDGLVARMAYRAVDRRDLSLSHCRRLFAAICGNTRKHSRSVCSLSQAIIHSLFADLDIGEPARTTSEILTDPRPSLGSRHTSAASHHNECSVARGVGSER